MPLSDNDEHHKAQDPQTRTVQQVVLIEELPNATVRVFQPAAAEAANAIIQKIPTDPLEACEAAEAVEKIGPECLTPPHKGQGNTKAHSSRSASINLESSNICEPCTFKYGQIFALSKSCMLCTEDRCSQIISMIGQSPKVSSHQASSTCIVLDLQLTECSNRPGEATKSETTESIDP